MELCRSCVGEYFSLFPPPSSCSFFSLKISCCNGIEENMDSEKTDQPTDANQEEAGARFEAPLGPSTTNATMDTEKGSSGYANSQIGLDHRSDSARAERELLFKLGMSSPSPKTAAFGSSLWFGLVILLLISSTFLWGVGITFRYSHYSSSSTTVLDGLPRPGKFGWVVQAFKRESLVLAGWEGGLKLLEVIGVILGGVEKVA